MPGESEEEWLTLLDQWLKAYEPEPGTLDYNFVRKAAEAEWRCRRNTSNYDDYLNLKLEGLPPYEWSEDQIKLHDLMLRYKTAAERTFQREFRALDTYYKRFHPKKFAPKPAAAKPMPRFTIVGADRKSPTGYSVVKELINGKEVINPRPFEPPQPIPPNWPKIGEQRIDGKDG